MPRPSRQPAPKRVERSSLFQARNLATCALILVSIPLLPLALILFLTVKVLRHGTWEELMRSPPYKALDKLWHGGDDPFRELWEEPVQRLVSLFRFLLSIRLGFDVREFCWTVLEGVMFSITLAAVLTFLPDVWSGARDAVREIWNGRSVNHSTTSLASACPSSSDSLSSSSSHLSSASSLASLATVTPSPAQSRHHSKNQHTSLLSPITPLQMGLRSSVLSPTASRKTSVSGSQAPKLRTRSSRIDKTN